MSVLAERIAEPVVIVTAAVALAVQLVPRPSAPVIASAPPVTPNALDVLRDLRTIHDVATLRLDDLVPAWSAAQVVPGPGSGSATVPGAYIEAETGRFVNPAQTALAVSYTGTFRTLAGVGGSGNYTCTRPLELHQRMPSADDYYSILAYGGTIVYRPNDGDGFPGAWLIFPEWIADIAPAIAFRQHERTAPDAGWNHLLAVEAFRAELEAGGVRDVAARLAATDDTTAAVFAYLVLTRGDPTSLVELVATSPKARAIALGAAAAELFDRASAATTVLAAARRHIAVYRDPALTWIFATFAT